MAVWTLRIGILAIILGLSSCKSVKPVVPISSAQKNADANSMLADSAGINYANPKPYYAKRVSIPGNYWTSKIKVERISEGLDITLNGTIRVQKDSIIWCSVNIGLGIEAVRIKITPTQFSLVDHINKQRITLPLGELSTLLGANLSFLDFQDLLLGNLPADIPFVPMQEKENLQQVGTQSGQQAFFGVLEKASGRTLQFQAKNAQASSLTISYNDFRPWLDNQIAFERIIETSEKSELGTVTTNVNKIRHTKFTLSELPLEFPFNMPQDYTDLRK